MKDTHNNYCCCTKYERRYVKNDTLPIVKLLDRGYLYYDWAHSLFKANTMARDAFQRWGTSGCSRGAKMVLRNCGRLPQDAAKIKVDAQFLHGTEAPNVFSFACPHEAG